MSALEIALAVLEYVALFIAIGYYTGFYRDRAFARLKIAEVDGIRVIDIPLTLVCLVPAGALSITAAVFLGSAALWPIHVLAIVLLGAHIHERAVDFGSRAAGHEVSVKFKDQSKDNR